MRTFRRKKENLRELAVTENCMAAPWRIVRTSRKCRYVATPRVDAEAADHVDQGSSGHAQKLRRWGESSFCFFQNAKNVRALGLL
jgi:hypothetical protein